MTSLLLHQNISSSQNSINILARARPSGEPLTASPICLCIVLTKLNSTEIVAAVGISVKIALGIEGGTNSLLYKVSAQM